MILLNWYQGKYLTFDYLPTIFILKLFYFDQSDLFKNKGVGLGLVICRNLIEFLGPSDEIEVESEIGKGSMFSF